MWRAIEPVLQARDDDPTRFEGAKRLGVDEHVWRHTNPKIRGPKMLTGMVDLTPDADGNRRTRLLDLVPGRSASVYADWLDQRGLAQTDHGRHPGSCPASSSWQDFGLGKGGDRGVGQAAVDL